MVLEGDDGTRRGDRVNEVFAWLSVDQKDDCEGIIAGQAGTTLIPLVGADRDRIESYRSTAKAAAKQFNVTIKLVRFSEREELEVIDGSAG